MSAAVHLSRPSSRDVTEDVRTSARYLDSSGPAPAAEPPAGCPIAVDWTLHELSGCCVPSPTRHRMTMCPRRGGGDQVGRLAESLNRVLMRRHAWLYSGTRS